MKKLIILLTLLIGFTSCSVKEKPEFLRVDTIKITETKKDFLVLTANAHFLNRNDVGGTLQSDGIKVRINDAEVATVSSDDFDVPANETFTIPLRTEVPIDSLVNQKNFEGLLGSLFSKKIKVQYAGDIKYKVFGFSHKYRIDKTKYIELKL